jgi:hypothetical protein
MFILNNISLDEILYLLFVHGISFTIKDQFHESIEDHNKQ